MQPESTDAVSPPSPSLPVATLPEPPASVETLYRGLESRLRETRPKEDLTPLDRAYRFAWVGHPTDRPAVALRGDRIYVSWNGATEVFGWHLVVDGKPYTKPFEGKRFVDIAENCGYWYFVVLSWLPIYAVIYFGARF